MLSPVFIIAVAVAKLPLRLQKTTMEVPVIPIRQNLNALVLHGLQGRGLDQAVLTLESAVAQSLASIQNSLRQPQGTLLTPIPPSEGEPTTFAEELTNHWSSIVKETVDLPRLGPLNPAAWRPDDVARFISPLVNVIPHQVPGDDVLYEADVPGVGHLVMTDSWQPHKLKPIGVELPVLGPILPLAHIADMAPPIQLPFKILPKSRSWLPSASAVIRPIEQIEVREAPPITVIEAPQTTTVIDAPQTTTIIEAPATTIVDAPETTFVDAPTTTNIAEVPIFAPSLPPTAVPLPPVDPSPAPVRRLGQPFPGVPIAFRKLGVLDDWRILDKPFFRKVLHYLPRTHKPADDDAERNDEVEQIDDEPAAAAAEATPPPAVALADEPELRSVALLEGKRFLVQPWSRWADDPEPILEF